MMLSSGQIVYSFTCEPETLARSYFSFLLTHSGIRQKEPKRAKEYLGLLGDVVKMSAEVPSSKLINNEFTLAQTSLDPLIAKANTFQSYSNKLPHEYFLCSLQHPQQLYCIKGVKDVAYAEFLRALSLYGPLNAVFLFLP
jgi:hypothetical protein